MKKSICLPAGPHEAISEGEFRNLLNILAQAATMNEQIATTHFGQMQGKCITEVAPIVAYLSAARAAWGLCSCAEIAGGEFDPVAFGKRCEEIAREQIDRYRIATTEVKGNA